MIPAFLKDEALLADIRAFTTAPPTEFHIWWLGQSGFLLAWNGKRLIFDPYLSDSLTRKYAETDKPHVRLSERVIEPASLTGIDAVTSSHVHTDHLDAETLVPLSRSNPGLKLVLPAANTAFARERLSEAPDIELIGLDAGESMEAAGFAFHGITAAHNEVERDAQGRCRFMGFVVTFGSFAVYHSGDTLLHDGLEDQLKPFACDLMLLPINGHKPERRVAGNLDGVEAAQLAKSCGAGLVIPCHYHMFAFNTEEPGDFIAACEERMQPYRVLRAGEGIRIDSKK